MEYYQKPLTLQTILNGSLFDWKHATQRAHGTLTKAHIWHMCFKLDENVLDIGIISLAYFHGHDFV